VSINKTLKQSERRLRATSFTDHWFSVATVKFNSLHLTGDYQDTTAKNRRNQICKMGKSYCRLLIFKDEFV
jgi:hypothetical protein